MHNINLTRLGGMPVTQYTFDFMQKTYQKMFNRIGNYFGPLVIVSGVEPAGLLLTDGLVCINGEMFEFVGGTAADYIDVFETVSTRLYEDGASKDVYYLREAKSSVAPGYLLSDFVRLPRPGEVSPTGMLVPWAGSDAAVPTGWLLADGQEVARATYAKLFDIIGTTYGVGNGTTTFNLPNTKGRVLVGLDDADVAFDTIGETGGVKEVTLDLTQIPSHTHTINEAKRATGSGSGVDRVSDIGVIGSGASNTTRTTAANGGGLAHTNLQPYLTMPHIIKY
jgi:microcystin-dependent protein